MITITHADKHYHFHQGWLETRHHFSFSDYYDPTNMNWGALRVFNDDSIAPASGFPPHAHKDMEIITYVLEGELHHQDSMGNEGKILPNEIQVMSAGKGIVHAEENPHPNKALKLLQMWLVPNQKNLTPRWEQRKFSPHEWKNKLFCAVSGKKDTHANALFIHQDGDFYISQLDKGKSTVHETKSERAIYLFVLSGEIRVNGKEMHARDSAKIKNEEKVEITAETNAHFVFWDCVDV